MGFRDRFCMDFGGHGDSFAFREPPGFGYAVVEEEEDDDAEEDCWNGLHDEEPLPPSEALAAGKVVQDEAGQRTADDSGNGVSCHQQGNHRGSAMSWKPVGEIEDHARKEASLRNAQ